MTVTDLAFNSLQTYVYSTLAAQVASISTELGTNPQGAYADVRTRLDVLEARLTADVFRAGGDISGTNGNLVVIGIQGNPILPQTLGPSQNGYVLTWNGSDWLAQSVPVQFVPGEDLSGTQTSQEVIGLLGNLLPSLSDGYLSWTGSKWSLSALPSSLTPSGAAGGDLSGEYPAPEVVGIMGVPIVNTTPTNDSVLVYNSNLSKYDIRKLTLDDLGPKFSITSFTGGSVVEVGTAVVNPVFNAAYSSAPTSAEITNTDGINSPVPLSSPFTSGTVGGNFRHTSQTSVTFTLSAVGATTQFATQSITYLPRAYGGVGSPGANNAIATGTINSPTAQLSTGNTINNLGLMSSPVGATLGPFSPNNQKIYLLLTGNNHTFKDASNGLGFSFLPNPTQVNFTNLLAATTVMFLYESTNTLFTAPNPYSILVAS